MWWNHCTHLWWTPTTTTSQFSYRIWFDVFRERKGKFNAFWCYFPSFISKCWLSFVVETGNPLALLHPPHSESHSKLLWLRKSDCQSQLCIFIPPHGATQKFFNNSLKGEIILSWCIHLSALDTISSFTYKKERWMLTQSCVRLFYPPSKSSQMGSVASSSIWAAS